MNEARRGVNLVFVNNCVNIFNLLNHFLFILKPPPVLISFLIFRSSSSFRAFFACSACNFFTAS